MNFTRRELGIFGLLAVIILLCGLGSWLGGFGRMGPGMMGPGLIQPGAVGGWGLLWQLLLCLVPLGLGVLLGGGLIWWLTAIRGQFYPVKPEENCPVCSRPVQPDWQVCPYCGTSLKRNEVT